MFKYTICFFTILIRLCFSLKYLPETSIKEELSIGSFVTTLTDKIPNLDQSDAYDLVSTSNDLDLFSIDHSQRTIIVKNRIDFEHLCRQTHLCNCKHCLINTNIAVSNSLTIDVYTLPIHVINIDDNKLYFNVNRTVIEIEENTSPISRQYFPLPMAIDDDFDSQIDYELYTINWQSTTLFRLTNTTTSIVNEKNIQFGIVNSSSSLLYLEPLKSFDREQQYIYLMRLVAKSGIHQISTDIIVLITDTNDNIPQCEQSYYKISINSMNDDNITQITAYDLDQGENARIAYNIVNQHIYPNNMFTIDHINGNMKFTYKNWTSYLDYFKNENSTKNLFQLKINVTDFGKPKQLSSECIIELEFTSILNIIIHLHEHLITNQTGSYIQLRDLSSPLAQIQTYDEQHREQCFNCDYSVRETDLLVINENSLKLNVNSTKVVQLLTHLNNSSILDYEYFPIVVHIDTWKNTTPAIHSTKILTLILCFDKNYLLTKSDTIYVQLDENFELNKKILSQDSFQCLQNRTILSTNIKYELIDKNKTFKIDHTNSLILIKHLDEEQQKIYDLTIIEMYNSTDQIVSTIRSNTCRRKVRLFIIDYYTEFVPYFTQPYYIFHLKISNETTRNIFIGNIQPFNDTIATCIYTSSSDLIFINSQNGSIYLKSALSLKYFYDFQIKAENSNMPSLNTIVPVRLIINSINQYAPKLLYPNNDNELIFYISSKSTVDNDKQMFLFQMKGYDPDINENENLNLNIPNIEFHLIEPIDLFKVKKFSGKIFVNLFFQNISSTYNLTVTISDYGLPVLSSNYTFIIHFKFDKNEIKDGIKSAISSESTISSNSWIFIIICFSIIIIILTTLIIVLNRCRHSLAKRKLNKNEKTWKNVSVAANQYLIETNKSTSSNDGQTGKNDYIITSSPPTPFSRFIDTMDTTSLTSSIRRDSFQRINPSNINCSYKRERVYPIISDHKISSAGTLKLNGNYDDPKYPIENEHYQIPSNQRPYSSSSLNKHQPLQYTNFSHRNSDELYEKYSQNISHPNHIENNNLTLNQIKRLSMTDINKYLERFERIYNDFSKHSSKSDLNSQNIILTSSEKRDPVGSVV